MPDKPGMPDDAALQPQHAAEMEIIPPPRSEAELVEAAQAINGNSPELERILRGCVDLDPLAQQRVLEVVKQQTKIGVGILREQVNGYRKEAGKLARSAGPRGAWIDKLKLKDNFEPQP